MKIHVPILIMDTHCQSRWL